MTRTIETTAYHYDELTEEAQAKARDWYRSASEGDNCFAECVIGDALHMGALLGIDIDVRPTRRMVGTPGNGKPVIYWSGFCSQGDGACFEGSYRYKSGAAKAIRAEAPPDTTLHGIADRLQAIQRRHFYHLRASCTHRGHYYHSGCMSVDVVDRGDEYRDVSNAERDIRDELRAFADWIYRGLESEWEQQNSDDAVAENIRVREYEFTEEGTVI
jgi:hypothetical protein